ncbi:MAG: sugar transferase [Actinobacteria bacterium]|nr:MAG: sugar transferase [Actinomycetota bacterium]
MSRWLRVRARLDRVMAALLAIPVTPLIGLLAYLVRRSDPGPGLVRLLRVGRDGRLFRLWKLRTMRAELPGGLATGSRITAGDDDRVTRTGEGLRRGHLDELPQLWNVIRGEMLLLGPRPETPALVDHDDTAWQCVLTVAPGIAGPTQLVVDTWEATMLEGDDAEDAYRAHVLPVKLAIDRWYVEYASPWIDLLVLVSLVQRFVFRRRETVIERRVRAAVPAAGAIGRMSLEIAA